MPLTSLRVEQFRCFEQVELELDPHFNFFTGANASGKTSLLEAAFLLGRGRSFRTRRIETLIRQGQSTLRVVGRAVGGPVPVMLGIEMARGSTEIRVAGRPGSSAAALAEHFPPQIIDPEIHKLLEEGPGRRRRFLDWGVFHVEPGFLTSWQRFHKVLRQRNASLKQGLPEAMLAAWQREFVESGTALAWHRAAYLEQLSPIVEEIGRALLGARVTLAYRPGWPEGVELEAALADSLERDRRYGSTQVGPQRADVTVKVDGLAAKERVSRGQQKLLAAGLTVAQLILQEAHTPGRSALMLDDPAAELDVDNLARLLELVRRLPVQLWVTSLRPEVPGLPSGGRRFHVEHGQIRPTE